MGYRAEILADSISPQGHRLTSMLTSYPRFVHSEHLRHRAFSYSVASSRALPTKALIERIMEDPVLPVYWGKYDKGMGAKEELTDRQQDKAKARWLRARDSAVKHVGMLSDLSRHHDDDLWDEEDINTGLSKELINRLLEPWMWATVVCSGTDAAWANFFWLRCHPAAQPEMREAALMMEDAYHASKPRTVRSGSWHLPFIEGDDWTDAWDLITGEPWNDGESTRPTSVSERLEMLTATQELLKQVSAARCARTSYLTHDGEHSLTADVALFEKLLAGSEEEPEQPMHLSPLEHVATPIPDGTYITAEKVQRIAPFAGMHHLKDLGSHMNKYGNLEGWMSLRTMIPDEDGVALYQRRQKEAQ